MLRFLRVKNFVHFPEEQTLLFSEGLNVFIGENDSGKTSIFEAVRRCLSSASNNSLSSASDPSKLSFVISVFDVPQESGMTRLVSCIVRLKTYNPNETPKYVKAVVQFLPGTQEHLKGVDLIRVYSSGGVREIRNAEYKGDLSELENCFLNAGSLPRTELHSLDTSRFYTWCENMSRTFSSVPEADSYNRDTFCEKTLLEMTEKAVFTFPQRNIGTIQWSLSDRMTATHKRHSYQEAEKRAEILRWFLAKQLTQTVLDLEQQMFDVLTENCGIRFEMDETGKIIVSKNNEQNNLASKSKDKKDTELLVLLKVPEGILEAKICSILLAVDQFHTVGLEHPERGQHPQMIKRLRDIILKRLINPEKKTVILTTHHPEFVSSWTLPRMHIFRKKTEMHNSIISGKTVTECIPNPKGYRTITKEIYTTLFFARRVLLVGGQTEYTFIVTLFAKLLQGPKNLDNVLSKLPGAPLNINNLQLFISSLQVIDMHGDSSRDIFSSVCQAIKLEHYFIPSVSQKAKESQGPGAAEKTVSGSVGGYDSQTFSWSFGRLEDSVTNLLNQLTKQKQDEFKAKLKSNHAVLPWWPKAVDKRDRLFSHPSLTDKNVEQIVFYILELAGEASGDERNDFLRLIEFLSVAASSESNLSSIE